MSHNTSCSFNCHSFLTHTARNTSGFWSPSHIKSSVNALWAAQPPIPAWYPSNRRVQFWVSDPTLFWIKPTIFSCWQFFKGRRMGNQIARLVCLKFYSLTDHRLIIIIITTIIIIIIIILQNWKQILTILTSAPPSFLWLVSCSSGGGETLRPRGSTQL